jgi:hypothetical protein
MYIYIFINFVFILIDLSLNYIYKSCRNLKYSKTLYNRLVFLLENILLYTKSPHQTILGNFKYSFQIIACVTATNGGFACKKQKRRGYINDSFK